MPSKEGSTGLRRCSRVLYAFFDGAENSRAGWKHREKYYSGDRRSVHVRLVSDECRGLRVDECGISELTAGWPKDYEERLGGGRGGGKGG